MTTHRFDGSLEQLIGLRKTLDLHYSFITAKGYKLESTKGKHA